MTCNWWTNAMFRAAATMAAAIVIALAAPSFAQTTAPTTYPDATTLADTLMAGNTAPNDRQTAAAQLAALKSPDAETTLINALTSNNVDIETAAARAIANAKWADDKFAGPLGELLGHSAALNDAASKALTLFPNQPNVPARMMAAITGPPTDLRQAPIFEALGAFPQKDVASFLIQHLEDLDETPEIRTASADALASMTGLGEYGQDAARWQQWWDGIKALNPQAFAAELVRERETKFADVVGGFTQLKSNLEPLLKSIYIQAAPAERDQILTSYLNNNAPEIRVIGAEIVKDNFSAGSSPSPAQRQKLLQMVVNDLSPEVRAAVVDALSADATSLPILQQQLAHEKDPELRVALLTALGKTQNPQVVSQAITLLDDPSLQVAQAAADVIADAGQTLRQPQNKVLADQCELALKASLNGRAKAPAAEGLERAVVHALGALADPNLTNLFQQLLDPKNSDGVRAMAIGGLGELAAKDPGVANIYLPYVLDSNYPTELRLKAAREMKKATSTDYYSAMVDRLDAHPDPDDEVKKAIWDTVQSWFPLLSNSQLADLASEFKTQQDPARQADVLRALTGKLLADQKPQSQSDAASYLETLGDIDLQNLHDPGRAALDFKRSSDIYEAQGGDLPPGPFRGEAQALLAQGAPFDQAKNYALQVLGGDPKLNSLIPDVMGEYAKEADDWSKNDTDKTALNNTIALVNTLEAAGVPAKLQAAPYIWDQLTTARDRAKSYLGQ